MLWRTNQDHRRHLEPDWYNIHRELKREHVTLAMWDEYIERHPEKYRHSRFWSYTAIGHRNCR
jgi:transposase